MLQPELEFQIEKQPFAVIRTGVELFVIEKGFEDSPEPKQVLGSAGGGSSLAGAEGRAAVSLHQLGADLNVVRRKFLRGGFVRRLNSSSFLALNPVSILSYRPVNELFITETLRAAGVRVPRVIAAGVFLHKLWPLYQGVLLTEYIPQTTNLLSLVRDGAPIESHCRKVGLEAGKVVNTSVELPDLHLGNVLTRGEELWLIDFDKARFNTRANASELAEKLVKRWQRSLRRHGVSEAMLEPFKDGLYSTLRTEDGS